MATNGTNEGAQEWNERADVLYHFHAYQYFAREDMATAMNLVNLTDADVQFYNRTSDMARGLGTQHQLAQYLSDFKPALVEPAPKTHRQKLMLHVRTYNLTVAPRRRFYILGLSSEDLGYMKLLARAQPNSRQAYTRTFNWATDGCADFMTDDDYQEEAAVENKIEGCLVEWQTQQAQKPQQTGENNL